MQVWPPPSAEPNIYDELIDDNLIISTEQEYYAVCPETGQDGMFVDYTISCPYGCGYNITAGFRSDKWGDPPDERRRRARWIQQQLAGGHPSHKVNRAS